MSTMFRRVAYVAPVVVVATPSCVDVAADRAAADERVGHAETPALRVDVAGGAACVRAMSDAYLDLRAQAPSFRATIARRKGQRELELRLRNLLPDAVVEVSGNVPVAVEARSTDGKDRRLRLPWPDRDEVELVVRAPDDESRAPFTFGVLADVQEAIVSVRDIYARMREDAAIRYVVFSGDLTRRGGQAELAEFEAREAELPVPLYATLGNHELGADEVYFHSTFGRGTYSFDYRGVAFSFVDTASATVDARALSWLEGWLAAARQRVHVVTMHIPPFDPVGFRNGAFASRDEAAKVVAMLAGGRVDLALYGHIHSFYAFDHAGVPAYISGGGGAIPERLDGIGRHYLTVTVDPVAGVRSVGVTRVD